MRKKFLAMYALVGALVASPIFTSCIDEGEESASVTAARDAKSAQIKATAEYEKQMNELNLALKQLQLEAEQANAEKVKHEVEAAIAKAKKETAQYTKEMYDYQDAILTELANNYTGSLNEVISYKEQIIKKNADLAALEQGVIEVQEYIVTETERLNNQIADAEAKIEIWKDAKGGINEEELFAQIKLLDEKNNKLSAEKTALDLQYGSTSYTKDVPEFDGNGNVTSWNYKSTKLAAVEAMRRLNELAEELKENQVEYEDGSYDWNFLTHDENNYTILKQAAVTYYKQLDRYDNDAATLEENKVLLAEMEAALGTEADKADTKYQYTETTMDFTLYAKLAAAKEALVAPEKAYTEKKAAYEKALAEYNAKATALNEATAALSAAQAALSANTDDTKTEALTAAVTAATTAKTEAEAAATTAETAKNEAETAYTPTEQPYNDAVDAVEDAELNVAKAIDEINSKKEWLAHYFKDAAEEEAQFDEWIAAFEGEDYEAYKAAVDAINAKNEEIEAVDNENDALKELYYNGKDVDALIAKEEADIAEYKEQLASIEKYMEVQGTGNYDGLGGWDNYSEAEINEIIALVKEQIARLEAVLELSEIRVEQTKAALDAYLATLDNTAEEA